MRTSVPKAAVTRTRSNIRCCSCDKAVAVSSSVYPHYICSPCYEQFGEPALKQVRPPGPVMLLFITEEPVAEGLFFEWRVPSADHAAELKLACELIDPDLVDGSIEIGKWEKGELKLPIFQI
jgi:hypothetical protein